MVFGLNTTTLTPGTKVRLTAETRAKVAIGAPEEYEMLLDGYTLKEWDPLFGWWEMEEPIADGAMYVYENEFEVVS